MLPTHVDQGRGKTKSCKDRISNVEYAVVQAYRVSDAGDHGNLGGQGGGGAAHLGGFL